LRYGRLQYRVQWKGYDEDPKFYPARNFINAPAVIKTFYEDNPTAEGPPLRLRAWLDAAIEDRFLEAVPADDLPASTPSIRITQRRR